MRHVVAWVVVLVVLSVSSRALAVDESTKREAQKRFAEGLHYYDVAEQSHEPEMYASAYRSFAQAYAIYPDDKVLWNLLLSEAHSDRSLEASRHLRLYESHQHVLDHPSHPKYKLMREYRERLDREIGHLTVDAPSGAMVMVDGWSVGEAPVASQDVAPGAHVIECAGQKFDATVSAGATVAVTVAPPPPAPVAAPTSLPASRPTPAAVLVDEPVAVRGGDHVARDVTRWSLTGLAVVGLGVGGGLLLDGNARGAGLLSFRAAHPGGCASMSSAVCTETQSMQASYSREVTASQVSLGIGAASAAAAVVSWVLWPRSDVRVGALLAPGEGALIVGGRL